MSGKKSPDLPLVSNNIFGFEIKNEEKSWKEQKIA